MSVPSIILASGSQIRATMLRNAGVDFTAIKPNTDEAETKKRCAKQGMSLADTALELAKEKALAIDAPPDAFVIGADQIMQHRGIAYDKPISMEEAKARLLLLQNDEHSLINGVCCALNGDVIFTHIVEPKLTLKSLSEAEIDQYLAQAGDGILSSVGAYQVEQLGARLFTSIEGDYFAVLGMSLFPLLSFLHSQKALDF